MLRRLPASLITVLRQSCKYFQDLIDTQADPVWDGFARKCLSGGMRAACLSDADGMPVSTALLQQAAVLAQLRALPFQAESIYVQPSIPFPTATSAYDTAHQIRWLWE